MHSKLIGAILLIASTTLGAGLLVLPIVSASYGLLFTNFVLILVWALFTAAAFLIIEVNLWLPERSNIVAMAKVCLSRFSQYLTWILYILFFYLALTSYFSILSTATFDLFRDYFDFEIPRWLALLPYALIVIIAARLGIGAIDKVNRILFGCFIFSFIVILIGIFPALSVDNFFSEHTLVQKYDIFLFVATALSYQFIIPLIRDFLGSDLHALRRALIWGSFLALFIYIIFEFFMLTALPIDDLTAVARLVDPSRSIAFDLSYASQYTWINYMFRWFAYFSVATAMLALSYSVYRFFNDSFKVQRWNIKPWVAILATFIPPFFYVYFFPEKFVITLKYTGLLSIFLFVIFPIALVWSGRYRKNLSFGYQVFGGKTFLLFLFFIALGVIAISFI